MTALRRLIWVGLLGAGGYAGWRTLQSRSSDDRGPAPEWPPLDPPTQHREIAAPPEPAASLVIDPDHDVPAPVESSPADSSFHTGSSDPDLTGGDTPPPGAPPSWVVAVDGRCPDGYPIKANDNSGIFHRPGGRFYDRTTPERCYVTADAAEADGYRAAKH